MLVYSGILTSLRRALTVGVAEGVVGGSVEDLHPGSGAGVAGVVRSDEVTPFLCSLGELAVGARVGPSWRVLGGGRALDVEASVRDTGVDGGRLENVGVSAGKDVGHHSTRASSDDVGPVCVSTVLADRVLDHVRDGLAVTATVVGQSYITFCY